MTYDCPVTLDNPEYLASKAGLVQLALNGVLVIGDQLEQCIPGGMPEIMKVFEATWPELMAAPDFGAAKTPPLIQFVNIQAEQEGLNAKIYSNANYRPAANIGSYESRRGYRNACRPIHRTGDGFSIRPETAVIKLSCQATSGPPASIPEAPCFHSVNAYAPIKVRLPPQGSRGVMTSEVKEILARISANMSRLKDLESGWKNVTCARPITEEEQRDLSLAFSGNQPTTELQDCTVAPETFGLDPSEMALFVSRQLGVFTAPGDSIQEAGKRLSFLPATRLKELSQSISNITCDGCNATRGLPLEALRSAYQGDAQRRYDGYEAHAVLRQQQHDSEIEASKLSETSRELHQDVTKPNEATGHEQLCDDRDEVRESPAYKNIERLRLIACTNPSSGYTTNKQKSRCRNAEAKWAKWQHTNISLLSRCTELMAFKRTTVTETRRLLHGVNTRKADIERMKGPLLKHKEAEWWQTVTGGSELSSALSLVERYEDRLRQGNEHLADLRRKLKRTAQRLRELNELEDVVPSAHADLLDIQEDFLLALSNDAPEADFGDLGWGFISAGGAFILASFAFFGVAYEYRTRQVGINAADQSLRAEWLRLDRRRNAFANASYWSGGLGLVSGTVGAILLILSSSGAEKTIPLRSHSRAATPSFHLNVSPTSVFGSTTVRF
jgi:hypothetical protein